MDSPWSDANAPQTYDQVSYPYEDVIDPQRQAGAAVAAPPSFQLKTHPGYGFESYTLAELEHMDISEPPMVVDYLIPYGLTILSGPPKTGKSIFCLSLADTVARGGHFLHRFGCNQGEVLYLGLEDTRWRMKARVKGMNLRWSRDIRVVHRVPPLDQGGMAMIAEYLADNEQTRLVIIDTLARLKPQNVSMNAYDHDARYANSLQEMAMDFGCGILLVHHDSKAGNADHLKSVSGSQGLTGAADAVVSLWRQRNAQEGRLAVTGRDIREEAFDMVFDYGGGGWKVLRDPLDRHAPKVPKWERADLD